MLETFMELASLSGMNAHGFDAEGELGRELLGAMGRLARRLGATEVKVWLVARKTDAKAGTRRGSSAVTLGLVAAGCAWWRNGRGRYDAWSHVAEAPRWPEEANDPRAEPVRERVLVRESDTRLCAWLHVRGELVGFLDMACERAARPNDDAVASLVQAVASEVAATWRHETVGLGMGAVAVLTPDARIEFASAAARVVLRAPALECLRAVIAGEWRETISLGPIQAQLERVDRGPSGADHRVIVRLQPAARLTVAPEELLSARQREVVELAAAGQRVSDIAQALGCRETTVKTHLRAAYAALGVASRVELLRALRPRE